MPKDTAAPNERATANAQTRRGGEVEVKPRAPSTKDKVDTTQATNVSRFGLSCSVATVVSWMLK